MPTYKFDPDYAVSPGETLREVMVSNNMTQKELAERTELTVQSLNRIFKGEQPITYETASRLELVTDIPARFWNNLEALYREQLAKLKEREKLNESLSWLSNLPVKELISRKIIEDQKDKSLLLKEILRFYGVSSVEAWHKIWETPAVAARRSPCFETQTGYASSWIRLGELQAQQIDCKPYDKKSFLFALEKIRTLTVEDPKVFEPEMKRLCADSGVSVSLVQEIVKVPWSGASKWLTSSKAMILLNLRGKVEDKFWFSFFHEAAHILNDNKKNLYIADNSNEPTEVEANRFAADFLIPQKFNESIRRCRSKSAIRIIARELGISPGIVAGRYQFLTKKWSYYKDQIRVFKWNKHD